MFVVLVVLVLITLFWLDRYTKHGQKITVPALKGLQIDEASAILQASKLSYEVVDSIYEKRGVPGSILEQIPRESSDVKEGRTIYLIVQAKAEQLVSIPDLADYSQRQAEALLNALGFTNMQIIEVPSDYKGLVVSVEYKGVPIISGKKIPKGSFLRLNVGNGAGVYAATDSTSTEPDLDPLFQ